MKKVICVLMSVLLLGALVGCTKTEPTTPDEPEPDPTIDDTEINNDGGWMTQDAQACTMSDEEIEIFNKTYEGNVGASHEPIALLATQVVAGTNYCFLEKKTLMTSDQTVEYHLTYIYQSLDGELTLLKSEKVDVVGLQDTESKLVKHEDLMGGWNVCDVESPILFDEVFAKAQRDLYTPVALLASQVVAGYNYCYFTVYHAMDDSFHGASLIYLYQDLDGNVTVTNEVPIIFSAQ